MSFFVSHRAGNARDTSTKPINRDQTTALTYDKVLLIRIHGCHLVLPEKAGALENEGNAASKALVLANDLHDWQEFLDGRQ